MPDPILISIATALATKTATGLYDLIKRKFSGDQDATAALETVTDEPKSIQALAERLDVAKTEDPEFAEALRGAWTRFDVSQHAESGDVPQYHRGRLGLGRFGAVLRPHRTPAALQAISPSAYTPGLCPTQARQTGLPCSGPDRAHMPSPVPRRDPPG